jgi:hypothetical protein
MRYDTAGDWRFDGQDRNITVTVMDTGVDDYNFLLIVHELIEAYLCYAEGISTEAVDTYDMNSNSDDPGDAPDCFYHSQHSFAVGVERLLASTLGVDWADYDQVLMQGDDEAVDY